MTNLELLNAATALVCEGVSDVPNDYSERAPYILAAFCTAASRAEKKHRLAYGLAQSTLTAKASLTMSATFPLLDIFAAPATYYLAAMLVIDENSDLAGKLMERCDDELDSIVADATAMLAAAEAKAEKEAEKAEKAAAEAAAKREKAEAEAAAKAEREAAEAAAKKEKEEAEAAAAALLPFKKESIVNVY